MLNVSQNNSHADGILGVITSGTMAAISNLETVEVSVRIFAGIIAIIAGIYTARYYHYKTKNLKDQNNAK